MVDLLARLWASQRSGSLDISEIEDLSVDAGLELQQQMLARWQQAGESLGGYKVGLTSGAARNRFGEGVRPFGYLLASRIFKSGANLPLAGLKSVGVENELVFRIGTTLSNPQATAAEVEAGIDGVAAGFEINQTRHTGASPGLHVADNLSQYAIVHGEFQALAAGFDWQSMVVKLSKDGELVQTLPAKGHIDDHFESIAALVRNLARYNLSLQPGFKVITGAYTKHPVERSGHWRGEFSLLNAEVEISFK